MCGCSPVVQRCVCGHVALVVVVVVALLHWLCVVVVRWLWVAARWHVGIQCGRVCGCWLVVVCVDMCMVVASAAVLQHSHPSLAPVLAFASVMGSFCSRRSASPPPVPVVEELEDLPVGPSPVRSKYFITVVLDPDVNGDRRVLSSRRGSAEARRLTRAYAAHYAASADEL